MGTGSKVWVINPDKLRGDRSHDTARAGSERSVYQGAGGSQGTGRESSVSDDWVTRHGSPALTLFSYLLGPFALLTTRKGRQSRVWSFVAIGSGVVSMIAIWRWITVLMRPEGKSDALIPWLIVSCVAILACMVAWSRAVIFIGRYKGSLLIRLPRWVRRPWTVGVLGIMVPGLGLLVAGRPGRAAGALWTVGMLLLSVLVISQAAWLWSWNQEAGFEMIAPSHTLEYVFLVIGAVGFLGALGWIVQALDGARLSVARTVQQKRSRGDLFAFALIVAIVIFSVAFEPAFIAKALDHFAVANRAQGFRIIPLCAALTAVHLDPSQPEYVMHAARLYDDLGRHDTAGAMREELAERLRPCMDMLYREGLLSWSETSSVPEEYVYVPVDTAARTGPPLASPTVDDLITIDPAF